MSTEIIKEPAQANIPIVADNDWALVKEMARAFAASPLVPKEYQGAGGLGSCAIAIDMARRINMSPMMVMQNLDIIHGRPSFRAQFLIATWNACGRFSAIRYKFSGEGDNYGCVAWAVEKATGEILEGTRITIGLAKEEGWFGKTGSKWKSMPEQMLRYRAASWLVRAYAPELSMGLQTSDEVEDTVDAEPVRQALPRATNPLDPVEV